MKSLKLDNDKMKWMLSSGFLILNILMIFVFLYLSDKKPDSISKLVIQITMLIIIAIAYVWFIRKIFHSINLQYSHKVAWLITSSISLLNLIIGTYAEIAFKAGVITNCAKTEISKLDAYYFSIVTFTTLGYGDFSPTENMRLIFASEALIGYLFFGVLVGLLVNAALLKEK